MSTTRLAAAQSVSVPGDIAANVQAHVRFIALAQRQGVGLLLFPELSLSGYELALLRDCCLAPQDARLTPLRDAACAANMTVVVGAPLAQGEGAAPSIGALAFSPDGAVSVYRKQHLHGSERVHASAGTQPSGVHAWAARRCALAICADISQPSHPQQAADSGAELYLASVLVSKGGYAQDAALLQGYARQHRMGVLMANHGAPAGGYVSAGRSAFWSADGRLVVAAPGPGAYLVWAQGDGEHWQGHVLPMDEA